MKIPKDIVTKNKIRDAKICLLWGRESMSMESIGLRFGISTVRVHQIISKNRHLIKIDKEYEKLKRLQHLKRLLDKHPDNIGNKGTLDIIESIRKEIGDDPSESGKGETKVIIIRESNGSANKDQSGDVPRSLSVLRV